MDECKRVDYSHTTRVMAMTDRLLLAIEVILLLITILIVTVIIGYLFRDNNNGDNNDNRDLTSAWVTGGISIVVVIIWIFFICYQHVS